MPRFLLEGANDKTAIRVSGNSSVSKPRLTNDSTYRRHRAYETRWFLNDYPPHWRRCPHCTWRGKWCTHADRAAIQHNAPSPGSAGLTCRRQSTAPTWLAKPSARRTRGSADESKAVRDTPGRASATAHWAEAIADAAALRPPTLRLKSETGTQGSPLVFAQLRRRRLAH